MLKKSIIISLRSDLTMKTFNLIKKILVSAFVFLFCLLTNCECAEQKQQQELITINHVGYDIYGQDCGGIVVTIANASVSKDKIGKQVFIKSTHEENRFPEGLISNRNTIEFYGCFANEKCVHLMGREDEIQELLFFVYDTIYLSSPYEYFDRDKKAFEKSSVLNHKGFHEQIVFQRQ